LAKKGASNYINATTSETYRATYVSFDPLLTLLSGSGKSILCPTSQVLETQWITSSNEDNTEIVVTEIDTDSEGNEQTHVITPE